MSKRFGRNQRRRLQAYISALEFNNEASDARIMRLMKDNQSLRNALFRIQDGVKRAFNDHHPLAETVCESNTPLGLLVRSLSSSPYDNPDAIVQRTCAVLELRFWPEPFRQAICYEVTFQGQGLARMEHSVKHVVSELKYLNQETVINSHAQYIARTLMEHIQASTR